ncbi:hypothetical protein [Streptomyces sp. TLI_146]|uniref:hypothetical protein n=1 Tax=Streptomyces sp. TLI_146 TaxID=1938858 RepID=UPI00117EFFC1|nr:hypothetical protein [Streptomyces sp. TLI_146]
MFETSPDAALERCPDYPPKTSTPSKKPPSPFPPSPAPPRAGAAGRAGAGAAGEPPVCELASGIRPWTASAAQRRIVEQLHAWGIAP